MFFFWVDRSSSFPKISLFLVQKTTKKRYLFQSPFFFGLGDFGTTSKSSVLFIKNHPTRILQPSCLLLWLHPRSSARKFPSRKRPPSPRERRSPFKRTRLDRRGYEFRVEIFLSFFLSFLYACGVYSRGRCLWEQIKFGNGKWTKRGVLSRPPTRARGLDAFEDIRFARSAPRRVLSRVARRGSTPCTLGRATEFEKYYYLFFCLFFDTLRLCVGPYRGGQKTIASLWKDKGAGKDFVSRFLSGPPHLYSKTVWLTVASSLSA